MAEYVIGAILTWSRGFHNFWRQQQTKLWQKVSAFEASGSTLGIVGYGTVGKEIAGRAKALGMNVIACRKSAAADVAGEPVDRTVSVDRLSELLAESDFVVDCLPSTPESLRFFNEETFSAMKQTAVFINIGRGETVDETALQRVLEQKRIAGAFLDVFQQEPLPPDHPLWTVENLFVTPHNSFASPQNIDKICTLFCDNLHRFISGESLFNVVDKVRGY